MMEPFLSDLLERLTDLHDQIRQVVGALPAAALEWQPGPGTNSITVLVVHLTGSERFWIGQVAGLREAGRDRAAEFTARGLDGRDLLERLDGSLALAAEVLQELTVADLAQKRSLAGRDRQTSVGWALAHALDHTAQHLGHIELTAQLWRQGHGG